jgi:hypothetical protein
MLIHHFLILAFCHILYFEYNQLDNLTRFSTIDASASKYPKMCALPNIHTPTHSFGLIRATLGATIDQVSGDVSEIMDRGVFWDVTPGVTNNSNFVQEGTPSSGVYTVDTEVTRGTKLELFVTPGVTSQNTPRSMISLTSPLT